MFQFFNNRECPVCGRIKKCQYFIKCPVGNTAKSIHFPALLILCQARVCCSYGAPSAQTVKGFDCVHIPAAVTNGANAVPTKSNLCGNNNGLPGLTVCCELGDIFETAQQKTPKYGMQERGSFFSIGLKYSLPVLSCLTYFFTQKAPASNICYRLPSTHGRWGGEMGGDAPPLASKNQSPPLEPKIRDLLKNWARKGGILKFMKIFSLIFVAF